jgi:hypothetical protein
MTVEGYLDEMESNDVYRARVEQIKKYLEIGKDKGINWANAIEER